MPESPGLSPTRRANATGLIAATLAASCCILPLALIFAGVAGAGLMMTMMRYEWITLPLGVIGIAGAWWMRYRQQRRCTTASCEFIGRRVNLAVLIAATLVVIVALLLRLMPSWTASLLESAPI